MLTQEIQKLFIRDLERLRAEINLYHSEESLWKNTSSTPNSGGSLCLHLCGNLQHFVGHLMGGSNYRRDRAFEFSGSTIAREQLVKEIENTKKAVLQGLGSDLSLDKEFPIEIKGQRFNYREMIIHLYGHFNYHLGQINFHRRLID